MEDSSEPSFAAELGQMIVTITIPHELEIEHFHVHRDVLTNCSPFFTTAFEGKRESLVLSDIKPATFRTFMDWCYFKRLPSKLSDGICGAQNCGYRHIGHVNGDNLHDKHTHLMEASPEDGERLLDQAITTYCNPRLDLYVLAYRLDVPKLRQNLMDAFFTSRPPLVIYVMIIRAFQDLPHNSPLCNFLVDLYVDGNWQSNSDEDCDIEVGLRDRLPANFLFRVMSGLADINNGSRKQRRRCAYHEHAEDEVSISNCKAARSSKRRNPKQE